MRWHEYGQYSDEITRSNDNWNRDSIEDLFIEPKPVRPVCCFSDTGHRICRTWAGSWMKLRNSSTDATRNGSGQMH